MATMSSAIAKFLGVAASIALYGQLMWAQKPTQVQSSFAEAEAIAEVLESGNRPTAANGAFEQSRGGSWDAKLLARYIGVRGVKFEDVNRPKHPRWIASKRELMNEIATRSGPSFYLLTYAAYRIGTSRRYASVAKNPLREWKATPDGATLVVENSIRLSFQRVGQQWILMSVELFEEQGE